MMAVGTQLDLEITLLFCEQEELDHLVVPESVQRTRRRIGRRIVVEGRLDMQHQLCRSPIDPKLDAGMLPRGERLTIPRRLDLEACSTHLYTDSMPRKPSPEHGPGIRARAATGWTAGNDTALLPKAVRRAFPALDQELMLRPLAGGLLHRSFHVRTSGGEYVLQRVSDVFAPGIHDNIHRVTAHLATHGLPAAQLLPTIEGALSADLGEQGRWRLMPHLGGATFEKLQSIEQARSAGALVGRFHAAMRDFREHLAPLGIPYRDTPRVLEDLRRALEDHAEHRLFAEMSALGRDVLATFDELGEAKAVPIRVIHGDLKLSNLLFESAELPGRDRAFALIDLDTLMRGTLWMELGDAWRSWCNPMGEDSPTIRFEMSFFEASLGGFLEGYGDVLPEPERDSLVTAPERLALELCARFITDAFEECYFGWDESRFESRGQHNAVRATGQWKLYQATRDCRAEREAILRAAPRGSLSDEEGQGRTT